MSKKIVKLGLIGAASAFLVLLIAGGGILYFFLNQEKPYIGMFKGEGQVQEVPSEITYEFKEDETFELTLNQKLVGAENIEGDVEIKTVVKGKYDFFAKEDNIYQFDLSDVKIDLSYSENFVDLMKSTGQEINDEELIEEMKKDFDTSQAKFSFKLKDDNKSLIPLEGSKLDEVDYTLTKQ